jgi:hypothetical protein
MTAANAPVPPAIVAPPDRFSAGRVFFCALTSAAPQVAFAVPMHSSLRHTLSMAKQVKSAALVPEGQAASGWNSPSLVPRPIIERVLELDDHPDGREHGRTLTRIKLRQFGRPMELTAFRSWKFADELIEVRRRAAFGAGCLGNRGGEPRPAKQRGCAPSGAATTGRTGESPAGDGCARKVLTPNEGGAPAGCRLSLMAPRASPMRAICDSCPETAPWRHKTSLRDHPF